MPLTECLKDTVARVLPYWHEQLAPAIRAGERLLISAHGNSMRALVKYLDNVSDADIVGLNIPNGIPLVYELDAALKPIRSYYLGDPEVAAAAAAAVARQASAAERRSPSAPAMSARSRAASARRSRRPMSRGGRNASRATTPSPQAEFHRLSASVVAPTNSIAALTSSLESEKRSATGCTGVAVEIAACSRLAWKGSRPWPVEVVPSGKIATVCPCGERLGHRVDDAQGVALALALEVERAGRVDQARDQRPAPSHRPWRRSAPRARPRARP